MKKIGRDAVVMLEGKGPGKVELSIKFCGRVKKETFTGEQRKGYVCRHPVVRLPTVIVCLLQDVDASALRLILLQGNEGQDICHLPVLDSSRIATLR